MRKESSVCVYFLGRRLYDILGGERMTIFVAIMKTKKNKNENKKKKKRERKGLGQTF